MDAPAACPENVFQLDRGLARRAARVLEAAGRARLTLITAESCTGGLLAGTLAHAPGAATWLHGGFVTYTKGAKHAVLGIPQDLLRTQGAVCAQVARAMAEGALARAPAHLSAALTGVAGPEPDEDGNPVGLVYCAAASRTGATLLSRLECGAIARAEIQRRAIEEALRLLQRQAQRALASG